MALRVAGKVGLGIGTGVGLFALTDADVRDEIQNSAM
jgi:hypothetical protein